MADLTYSDASTSIRNNAWFRSRVEIAISKKSNYLINTPIEDPEYETKQAYGQRLAQQAMMITDQLMFTLGGDSEILAAGPAIPDADLQPIVEKLLEKLYPPTTAAPVAAGMRPPAFTPRPM
jgi:hypothetical protein